ncbi:MAG: family 20 glycosylhydrolase [Clostridia bacterium]|nr:family 20 glycosylhydrolase [Clostridia bacterium]
MNSKTVFIEKDFCEKGLALLSLFIPRCDFKEGDKNADIVAKKVGKNVYAEEYFLKIKSGKAYIEYQSYLGLRNALATLSLMAFEEGGELLFKDIEITDSPAASHRGAMLDNARGVMPIDRLFCDMVLIAKAKFNFLHLHFADSKGSSIELDCLPEEYRLPGYYTKEQVKKLIEFADLLGLEIIPEFDMPAHSTKLNHLIPELRCDIDFEDKWMWTTCAGTEKTYEIYKSIIEEISEMFKDSRYFHIGGDELYFDDLGRPCHWQVCKKCLQKMKEEGLKDRQDLYYYFINRINSYVKDCKKQTIMWSDQIDCTRSKGLDDDIVMQFWRISHPERGPSEGCSFDKQLGYGYNAINSYYPHTYVDLGQYATKEKIESWRWDETPEVSEKHKSQILGGEFCAWEYGNCEKYQHYDYSLPSAIILFGDKLWRGQKDVYGKDAELAVTRAVLGSGVPEGFNVFDAIGGIIAPRMKKPDEACPPCDMENITASKQDLEKIIEILSNDSLFDSGDKMRAGFYKKCAEYALKNKD